MSTKAATHSLTLMHVHNQMTKMYAAKPSNIKNQTIDNEFSFDNVRSSQINEYPNQLFCLHFKI